MQYLTGILKNCFTLPHFPPYLINGVSPGKIFIEAYFSPLLGDFVPGFKKCWSVFLSRESIQQWSTFKGKMTDHRYYATVVVRRALFASNATANGFCIKLNQSYRRLIAVICKPARVLFLLILIHTLAGNCCYTLSDGVAHRSSDVCCFRIKHPQLLSLLVAWLSAGDHSEQPRCKAAGVWLRVRPRLGSGCSQTLAQGVQGDCPTNTSVCAKSVAHFPHSFDPGQLMLSWTKHGLAQSWDCSLRAVWMRLLCFSGWRVSTWMWAVLCQTVR